MNRNFLIYLSLLIISFTLPIYTAPQTDIEMFDHKDVASITIKMKTLAPGEPFDSQSILSIMRTKVGDPFSQPAFDADLKMLSSQYQRVDPSLNIKEGKVFITIDLWEHPIIQKIKWHGNKHIPTKKLQKELGITPYSTFDRETFNEAFNKLKDLYIKKGYFEAQLGYTIDHIQATNEVVININIHEGRSAHVGRIKLYGFTENEQREIWRMINTKKFDIFTSWLTGTGYYNEEAIDHDRQTIINYLQSKGYADAHVSISIEEHPDGDRIYLIVKAERGPKYHFGTISISGNSIFTREEIEKHLTIHPNDVFSPETLRQNVEIIKGLYGQKGYIDTIVQYEAYLSPTAPMYDINFTIDESEQFRIGVVRVLGNVNTNTAVVLNESLLVPGEVFDQRKLKATQQRLMAMGYFKSVNVYAVRNPDDLALGPDYRDVIIEVEETMTGSMSLFFGLSSTDSIFGGLDLTENNFNYKGLTKFWKEGFRALRGGGEYAQARISFGKKQSSYQISWLTPYFKNTLWNVGFDANYSTNRIITNELKTDALGFSLYGSYPVSAYWTSGWTYRIRNSIIHVANQATEEAKKQNRNSGLVSGIAGYLTYNSTDNPIRPHFGFRSSFEAEIDVVRRHDGTQRVFPFLKFSYLNSYYYPVWAKGTLKLRGDAKALKTLGDGLPILLPTNERYYLGGEATVRGYQPGVIGPEFNQINDRGDVLPKDQQAPDKGEIDPTGGASSLLLSVEYLQNVIAPIDVFVFFDAGAISLKEFHVGDLRMSTGAGIRLNVGNRLPMTIGVGYPINPENRKKDRQTLFFSMGGQF